jgi:hypothetical protein
MGLPSSSVKRVIITSSIVAIANFIAPPGVFTEKDWNDDAIKHVEEQGDASNSAIVYCASKTLAEKGKTVKLDLCLNLNHFLFPSRLGLR